VNLRWGLLSRRGHLGHSERVTKCQSCVCSGRSSPARSSGHLWQRHWEAANLNLWRHLYIRSLLSHSPRGSCTTWVLLRAEIRPFLHGTEEHAGPFEQTGSLNTSIFVPSQHPACLHSAQHPREASQQEERLLHQAFPDGNQDNKRTAREQGPATLRSTGSSQLLPRLTALRSVESRSTPQQVLGHFLLRWCNSVLTCRCSWYHHPLPPSPSLNKMAFQVPPGQI